MIAEELKLLITKSTAALGYQSDVALAHAEQLEHGDYTTNTALAAAKKLGKSPHHVARMIAEEVSKHEHVLKTEVAGPGFVNIFLKHDFFAKEVDRILHEKDTFGYSSAKAGQTEMYEYTDPNPLKVFHIGHLMSNAIGEALSRLAEWTGARVIRANYQGDVGLHIAKAVYGMRKLSSSMPGDESSLSEKSRWLGAAYVAGAASYEESEEIRAEIARLNRAVYEKSDPELTALVEKGKSWSLAHFEEIYRKLGTKFDRYYFESEIAEKGLVIVREGKERGILVDSEGATIFKGEDHGLHTRVFVNSDGLPTYEAKELGLTVTKFEDYPELTRSIIVTANEITEYMKVVLKALSFLHPSVAAKTEHIPHGFMFGPGGKKMSSRTGGVISGEELLEEMEALSKEYIQKARPDTPSSDTNTIAARVAVAAIKYSVLKQGIGRDAIFDREQALSFEGDSGPYLLYTYARAKSVLRKAAEVGITLDTSLPEKWESTELERRLYWLPEIISRAADRCSPNLVTQYLIELSQTFNRYYGHAIIVDSENPFSSYRLALTAACAQVLKNGLTVLGIETIEKM